MLCRYITHASILLTLTICWCTFIEYLKLTFFFRNCLGCFYSIDLESTVRVLKYYRMCTNISYQLLHLWNWGVERLSHCLQVVTGWTKGWSLKRKRIEKIIGWINCVLNSFHSLQCRRSFLQEEQESASRGTNDLMHARCEGANSQWGAWLHGACMWWNMVRSSILHLPLKQHL